MDREKALRRSVQIIDSQQFASLSTVDKDKYPVTRIVFNLRSGEDYPHVDRTIFNHANSFILYFGTNTSSDKVAQIKSNPRISAYFSDLETWEGVLLAGRAEFVEDLKIKSAVWDESWNRYYSKGLEDPDFCLIRLIPEKLEIYGQLSVHKFKGGELNGI